MLRTHTCGDLTASHAGEQVTLAGWVQKVRTHGNLCFIDLRDRYGITQLTFKDSQASEAGKLHKEDVIKVSGEVVKKPEPNEALPTGDIEVSVGEWEVLNKAKPLPLDLDNPDTTEETRLKYRYLDLRRPEMQERLKLRSKAAVAARKYLDEHGFLEIETPILGKSTPEGARDYLVPSRVHQGSFYALPQSPQIFKQLFQVSGLDRYMQVVKCFRDEDLRADRQPEFTQIDLELSFVEEEDIYGIMEGLMKEVWKETLGVELETPFLRMSYHEAMKRYGSDKPDTRFGLDIQDVTEWAKKTEFKIFQEAPCVRMLHVNKDFSRKDIDRLTEVVKNHGAKGLAWAKKGLEGLEGGISKFLSEAPAKMEEGDHIFFVADDENVVAPALGSLRNQLGKELGLIDRTKWNFLWVTDFPLMEWSEEDSRYVAMHHPFTSPCLEDRALLKDNPEKARSRAYDLTLNGVELGGGSIRIHDQALQQEVFDALNISKEEQERKFGFLLNALGYGAPPHGGIAFGFDRMVMLLAGADNIREVIAFPKTKDAEDLMLQAPGTVSEQQLDELGVKIEK
ncbi:aspartate--tRNA ligase [Candidatus Woesearchaeota archaeon]|nr:aspartate--tRNA ligase [Candidatus Woesearchaeota archaeon]